MSTMHYVGLDVHKKTISYCVKTKGGTVRQEGAIEATRETLGDWVRALKQPWSGAMEATLFTGWIYDRLKPHARKVERGNKNRATLAVARKLVAYLMAVDKSGKPFEAREQQTAICEQGDFKCIALFCNMNS